MILSSNIEDGTYKRIDIDQRVAYILNKFTLPSKHLIRNQYSYQTSTEIKNLRGYLSYTATVRFGRHHIRPCMVGSNCFWGIGYVGVEKGVPFYSSRTNARRAVALRVIVDYFAFAYDGLVSNQKTETTDTEDVRYWPHQVMNKTSPTLENFVVLYENGEYKINNGKKIQDDHLFCILVRHSAR